MKPIKFDSIPHLPWSNGVGDDSIITSFRPNKIVVTEKLDGECTSMYRDYFHARSVDSNLTFPGRSWAKKLHGDIKHLIPYDMRIVGENIYIQHSIIQYDKLPSYFFVFCIFTGTVCLSWEETKEWCQRLGLEHVPVLYKGSYDQKVLMELSTGRSAFGNLREGYVVRNADKFGVEDWEVNIAKCRDKVTPYNMEHWSKMPVTINKLSTKERSE